MKTTAIIGLLLISSTAAFRGLRDSDGGEQKGHRGGNGHRGGKGHGKRHNEMSPIIEACQDNLLTLCPDAMTPEDFGACFLEHKDEVSEECLAAVTDAKAQDDERKNAIRTACEGDMEAIESKDFDSVSEECKAAIEENKPPHSGPHRKVPEECEDDKEALRNHDFDSVSEECKAVLEEHKPHHELPEECADDEEALKNHDFDSVSEECKAVLEERKPHHELPEECADDEEALKNHDKDSVSEECKAALEAEWGEGHHGDNTDEDSAVTVLDLDEKTVDAFVVSSFAAKEATELDDAMEEHSRPHMPVVPVLIGGVLVVALAALIVKKVRSRRSMDSTPTDDAVHGGHVTLVDEEEEVIVTGIAVATPVV